MRKHHRLDDGTADRLLNGTTGPDDAPPGFVGASMLLNAARSDLGPTPVTDVDIVASMVDAIRTQPRTLVHRRKSMLTSVLSAKAAAVVGALVLSATGAAAATGNLPPAAQDGLSKAVSHVGVDLPRSDKAEGRGQGGDVSDKATSGDTTGAEKGADVSKTASDGRSRAGDDHPSADEHPTGSSVVETPNGGGTGTAGTASDGASDAGTTKAPAGAAAGSGNAGEHPTADEHPAGRE